MIIHSFQATGGAGRACAGSICDTLAMPSSLSGSSASVLPSIRNAVRKQNSVQSLKGEKRKWGWKHKKAA